MGNGFARAQRKGSQGDDTASNNDTGGAAVTQPARQQTINPSTLRSRKRRARMTSNERTTERSYYARKRRIDLVRELAPEGKCDECGCVFDHEHLTVDHRDGRPDWIVSEVSPSVRSARYWAEYKAGVPLRALCGQCNSVDGGSRRYFGAR